MRHTLLTERACTFLTVDGGGVGPAKIEKGKREGSQSARHDKLWFGFVNIHYGR